MIDTASESERFCPENRGGRRRAGFALVGIVAALGFCANATPALASDGVEPPPLVPELGVSEEIPPLPELDVDETAVVPVPEEPPIVIDTSLEGDDVDVSIRVLSPGENELEAPVDATSDVISETLEPDITADPVLPDTLPTPTVPIEQEAVLEELEPLRCEHEPGEHDRLALEVRQLHGVAVVVAPREVGRLVTGHLRLGFACLG